MSRMTVRQYANHMGTHKDEIYVWIKNGTLPDGVTAERTPPLDPSDPEDQGRIVIVTPDTPAMSRYESARHTEAHEFDLIMTKRLTGDEVNSVEATGADDFILGLDESDTRTRLCFTRAADTFAEALVSAVRDIERAGLGDALEDVRCLGTTGPDATAIGR